MPLPSACCPDSSRHCHSIGFGVGKNHHQPDGRERFKVEHDDIQRLAAEHQMDYLSAQQTINNEVARTLGYGT